MSTPKARTIDGSLFVAVTVDFYNDPKIDDAVANYAGAGDMFIRLIAYSRQNLTDGRVELTAARRIASPLDSKAALAALAATGLITVDNETRTVTVVAYALHQQTKDEVIGRRAREAADRADRRARASEKTLKQNNNPGVRPDNIIVRADNARTMAMSAPEEGEGEVEEEREEDESNFLAIADATAAEAADVIEGEVLPLNGNTDSSTAVVARPSGKNSNDKKAAASARAAAKAAEKTEAEKEASRINQLSYAIAKPWHAAQRPSTLTMEGTRSVVVKALRNGVTEAEVTGALMEITRTCWALTGKTFDNALAAFRGQGPHRGGRPSVEEQHARLDEAAARVDAMTGGREYDRHATREARLAARKEAVLAGIASPTPQKEIAS